MNPGPTLGLIAVVAAYTVVLGGLVIFLALVSNRERKLKRRRTELKNATRSR